MAPIAASAVALFPPSVILFGILSAFLNARGAPPPLALARRLRASLGPQALRLVPCPLSLVPCPFSLVPFPFLPPTHRLRSCAQRPREFVEPRELVALAGRIVDASRTLIGAREGE